MTLLSLSRMVTELIQAYHLANRFSYILQASVDTLDPQRDPPDFKTWVISLRYNYPEEDMRDSDRKTLTRQYISLTPACTQKLSASANTKSQYSCVSVFCFDICHLIQ